MLKRATLPTLCLLTIALAAGLALAGCQKGDSQQTNFQMGDRVVVKPMLYNVVQTVWKTQLGSLFKVRVPDHRFLLISLSATNNGGGPVGVPFLTLEGANHEEYHELQNGEGVDDWFGLLRDIAPGETRLGNIVFDVPLATYRLRLTNGGEPGSEKLVWVDIPLRIDTDTGTGADFAWAVIRWGWLAFLLMAWPAAAPAFAALAVDRIALHQFEDGPVLGPNHAFLPGETVYFSCRLTGYQLAGAADAQRSVKLSWKMQVTDPKGVPLVMETSGEIAEPVATQDKNWYPKFLQHFNIPPFAPGGAYHIKITARDEVAKADLTSQLDFQVRGHSVEPSDVLTARSLRFVKDETDGPPLDPAVYHPGETMWARFDMTGFKYGDKNHYSVEYGLAILRESGEQVFAQPAAAADASEGFYPQRYVPGAVSLNLQPNVPEGSYTLVITMEDKVGGQMAEARAGFRIQK